MLTAIITDACGISQCKGLVREALSEDYLKEDGYAFTTFVIVMLWLPEIRTNSGIEFGTFVVSNQI